MDDVVFSYTAAIAVAVVVLWVIRRWRERPTNLPPGPTPWPVIGNMWLLRREPVQRLCDLRKQYGDVVGVYMGSVFAVFVHGPAAIRQMLVTQGEEFADRGETASINQITKGKGIVSASGHVWKEQRRFSLRTLRDFGFGKKSLEARILGEADVILKELEQLEGQKCSCAELFNTATSNVIASIVFGDRFSPEDAEEREYTLQFSKLLAFAGFADLLSIFPWLRYIPGDIFGSKSFTESLSFVQKFTRARIDEHKKTLDSANPRDFIDAYLIEKSKVENNADTTFSDDQLEQVVIDLAIGGTETSSVTLLWAILFLVNYPDVQKKLRAEIHSVIGKSRIPCLADRQNMPYTVAVINEVQRLGDLTPIGPPRAPKQDTTLNGYYIPKGTPTFPMLHGLHQDSRAWKNPKMFDPSRFLDADGQVINSQFLMPFSAGKRVCLGESLARTEIFLFLTSILQKFHFRLPEGVTSYREDGILGLSHAPQPFLVTSRLDI